MDISSDRKRQLKAEYRLMKPDMGVLAVICRGNSRHYVEASSDVRSRISRIELQLSTGMHPNKQLQRDWQAMGQGSFEIKVLEKLEYSRNESKTDYGEDLSVLKSIWAERLIQQGIEIY